MSETRYATYMTDQIGPLPYCPGCGHEPLVKALDGALVKLQPDPKDVVIVTDIGCIGLSDSIRFHRCRKKYVFDAA